MIIKKIKHNQILYNVLLVILFIIMSVMSIALLFKAHYLFGAGDLQFHAKRIFELKDSFDNMNILPLFGFNYFHGSAVMSLYPYLNILPIVVLCYFIKSKIEIIYLFMVLVTFISLIVSYYSSISFSKSRLTSLIFSTSYSCSTLFLTYDFYDMDLGIINSMIFLPLVIFGFIDLICHKKWLKMSLGMTFILYGHVLNFVIIFGLLFLWLIFNYKQINRQVILCITKACLLIILLTSIIWVPAIKLSVYNIGNIYPPSPDTLYGSNIFNLILNGLESNITYGLSIISICGLIIPIICYKIFYNKFSLYVKQMYIISCLIFILSSNIFPWKIANFGPFKILKIIQFPWRFYIIPELLLCYVFAVCITKCISANYIKYILFALSIVIIMGSQLVCQNNIIHESINSPELSRKYMSRITYTKDTNIHHIIEPLKLANLRLLKSSYYKNPGYPYYKIGNNGQLRNLVNTYTNKDTPDYYPIKSLIKINYINNNKGITYNNRSINIHHKRYNTFTFDTKSYLNKLSLPLLIYKGEKIRLYLNHKRVKCYSNKYNMITLNNVRRGNNCIYIKYIPNTLLLTFRFLLFLCGIYWIFMIVIGNIRNERFNG